VPAGNKNGRRKLYTFTLSAEGQGRQMEGDYMLLQ